MLVELTTLGETSNISFAKQHWYVKVQPIKAKPIFQWLALIATLICRDNFSNAFPLFIFTSSTKFFNIPG